MSKIKRPTLTTTKNCIMLLKEAHGLSLGYFGKEQDGIPSSIHVRDRIEMVLTMLTDEKSWMEK